MLQWLLFGGAPLLAVIWMVTAAVRAPANRRRRATGAAAVQAVIGIVVLYGLVGSVRIAWLLLSAP